MESRTGRFVLAVATLGPGFRMDREVSRSDTCPAERENLRQLLARKLHAEVSTWNPLAVPIFRQPGNLLTQTHGFASPPRDGFAIFEGVGRIDCATRSKFFPNKFDPKQQGDFVTQRSSQ